jgi:cell division protein FtsL
MQPTPHTTKRRSARRWLATAAVLAAVLGLYEMVGESGYMARREQQQTIESLNHQVGELQSENARLSQEIHELRSDPAAIEEMAREQLHLARPGEVVVTLPADSAR